jgi:hypothetical protein
MKKFMSLVMIVAILVCTLWLSVGKTSAAGTITYTGAHYIWGKGIAFTFDVSGYRNRDLKNASLTIGSKSFDVHCRLNKEKDRIVCVAAGGLTQYVGTTGILYVAGYAFYVTIPDKPALQIGSGSGPLSCPDGTEPGAYVIFRTGGGDTTPPQFVSGSTPAEVRNNAESWIDGSDIVGIKSIGSLECREILE